MRNASTKTLEKWFVACQENRKHLKERIRKMSIRLEKVKSTGHADTPLYKLLYEESEQMCSNYREFISLLKRMEPEAYENTIRLYSEVRVDRQAHEEMSAQTTQGVLSS